MTHDDAVKRAEGGLERALAELAGARGKGGNAGKALMAEKLVASWRDELEKLRQGDGNGPTDGVQV